MKPRRSPSPFSSALLFTGAVLSFFLFAGNALASTGFISSPMWISPASPEEGDKVTISAVFHNEEDDTISGSILFYDGNTLLAEKPVMLRPDEVQTVTTMFTITAGSHLFSASTKNLSQVSSTGGLEVIAVPVTTVKLPLQFVPKTIVPAAAQASGDDAGDATSSMVLDQVDKAQTAVLNALPPATKEAVTKTTSTVDGWRSDQAETFTASRDDAKKALDAASAANAKAGTSVKSSSAKKSAAEAGPLTELKYILFSALAFIFGSPVIFYLAIIVVVYLLIRFLWSRMRKGKKAGRAHARPAKDSSHSEH